MLRVRFQGPTGSTLAYSVEQLSGATPAAPGPLYDFSATTLTAALASASAWASLPEEADAPGCYSAALATPRATFADGEYCVRVKDAVAGVVVGVMVAALAAGDDFVPPSTATVTGPVTVGGFAPGVTLPIDPHDHASASGSVSKDPATGVLTWYDPGTRTPRLVITPDGNGGYTSQLL